MTSWVPYTFYPNPSPDADSVFYVAYWQGSFPVFKKVNQKTGETSYGFRPDAMIWFTSEAQIVKFLSI